MITGNYDIQIRSNPWTGWLGDLGGGVEAPRISTQSAYEGGKVGVGPTHRPSLPLQKIFLVLISVRG